MTRSDHTGRPAAPPSGPALETARAAVLGAVTGSLIHAIGQPLTIIRLAAERVSADASLDAAAADVVVDQVARLETMFQHLDVLARAGRGSVRRQPVVAALSRALDILRPLSAPRGPAVTITAPPELAEAEVAGGDGLVLLLAVALLHDSLSRAAGQVTVTLAPAEGRRLALSVEDDRVEGPAAAGHAAVVAEALGGRCTPAATAPHGVRLDLPLAEAVPPRPEAPTPVAGASRPVPAVPVHGARVVLVEDEFLIADMMADVLTEHGFDVEVCAAMADALTAVAARAPDVVVSDLTLPDGPGEALLDRLAADWPQVFTVALSGRELDADAVAPGAVDLVLRKPVAAESLAEALVALLSAAGEE